jgi:DNA polymerase III subunit delta
MGKASHCYEILLENKLPDKQLPGVIVAYGDDDFLRKESIHQILKLIKIEQDEPKRFNGEECKWLDVHDELATMSLFAESTMRIAIVVSAEDLIKAARPQLEKWCGAPAADSVLILDVPSFPSNTKLYKIVAEKGWCIDCGLPTGGGRSKSVSLPAVQTWVQQWGTGQHGLKLTASQAKQILEAVGTDSGILHQELAKLALYADANGVLPGDAIKQHVGSWRTRTMWEIADAVADGRIADALRELERVFATGEHPAAVVPQISWSLRRFGTAAQLILQARRTGQSISAQAAIAQSGFWGNDAKLADERLRRIGLYRASHILQWLLELDLKIKGSHSNVQRAQFALEELCLRFA